VRVFQGWTLCVLVAVVFLGAGCNLGGDDDDDNGEAAGDTEGKAEHAWGNIHEIKKAAGGKKLLVAVAGGVKVENAAVALKGGADILVVGRAITNAKDIEGVSREFLEALHKEEIDQYRIMTDF